MADRCSGGVTPYVALQAQNFHTPSYIQSSAPMRYAIVDGLDVRDSRVHNYPPRWNGAPSQDLLVIRRNHDTGQISLDPLRWGVIPYLCKRSLVTSNQNIVYHVEYPHAEFSWHRREPWGCV